MENKSKNNWKMGFWIVTGLLFVTTFYLFYVIGSQAETIEYFCDFSNDAIDVINQGNDVLSYYVEDFEYETIEPFDCYLY